MAAIFQIKRGSTQASLTDGELYLHYDKGTLQISSGSDTPLDLLPLNKQIAGNIILQGNLTASNAFFTGDVAISGNLFLGNNQSDNINALGVFTSNITPGTTNVYSIGTTTAVWAGIYGNIISGSQITGSFSGPLAATNNVVSGAIQILGGSGILSASNINFSQFTASIQTSTASLNAYTASVSNSVYYINNFTASTSTSLNLIHNVTQSYNSFSASVSSSVLYINNFTSSTSASLGLINSVTQSYNSFSASVSSSVLYINNFTASTSSSLGLINSVTQSYTSFSSSVSMSLRSMIQTTSSINAYTASVSSSILYLNNFTSSTSASLNLINSVTQSYNTFSTSVSTSVFYINNFTSSASGSIRSLHQTSGSLNSYTQSTNLRLNEIEGKSSSFDTNISRLHLYTQSLQSAISASGTDLIVIGNLTVQGTQTTLNTNELIVEDKFITIASGSTNAASADGAGIYIDGAAISMSWDNSNTRMYVNTNFAALGSISGSTIVGLNGISVSAYSASVFDKIRNIESVTSSYETIGRNIVSQSSDTNSIKTTITNGSISSIAIGGVVSGSSQIDATQTTNWSTGIKTQLNSNTVVSGSSQIDATQTTNWSNGIKTQLNTNTVVSGSSQIDATQTTNWTSGIKTQLNTNTVISGSSQVDATQTTNWISGIKTQLNTNTVVSGSSQIDATQTTNWSSGIKTRLDANNVISGSSQVNYGLISNVPTNIVSSSNNTSTIDISIKDGIISASAVGNIVSSSAQVISFLPTGTISGSSQILNGSGILSSSNTTFAAYTSSTNIRLNDLEAGAATRDNSISRLNTFTSSLEDRFTQIETATSSLFASSSTLTASFTALRSEFDTLVYSVDPNSQSLFTADMRNYTSSVNLKFETLRLVTSSILTFTESVDLRLNNLELTGSINSQSIYFVSSLTSSISNRLTDLETTASFTSQSAYTFTSLTGSFFALLNDLALKTGSYATTGSNLFISNQTISGSVSISGSFTASLADGYAWVGRGDGIARAVATSSFSTLLPDGILSSSYENFSTYSSSVHEEHMNLSMSVYDSTIEINNRLINVVSSSTNTPSITLSIKEGIISASAIGGIVSQSSQIDVTQTNNWASGVKSLLNSNTVISGASQIDYFSISGVPSNIVSQSSDTANIAFSITDGRISANLRGDVISRSAQVDVTATQNYSSVVQTTGNQTISGIKTFTGDVILQGNTTYTSQNQVNIGDNILALNYGFSARFGGLQVRDSSGGTSGSLLYDGENDRWVAGQANDTVDFPNLPTLLTNGGLGILSSSNQTFATYTGSADRIFAALQVATSSLNTYTGSADRIFAALQTATSSLNGFTSSANRVDTALQTATSSLNTYTGSADRIFAALQTATSSLNTYTGSADRIFAALQTATSSLNIYTGSADRIFAALQTATSSLNTFTGSVFTKGGTLVDYFNGVTTQAAIALWRAPYACSVQAVRGRRIGGDNTSYFGAAKSGSTGRVLLSSSGSTTVGSVSLLPTEGLWTSSAIITANQNFSVGDTLEMIVTGSSTSAPNQLAVQIEFIRL